MFGETYVNVLPRYRNRQLLDFPDELNVLKFLRKEKPTECLQQLLLYTQLEFRVNAGVKKNHLF